MRLLNKIYVKAKLFDEMTYGFLTVVIFELSVMVSYI